MKFRNIYFICKNAIQEIEKFNFNRVNTTAFHTDNWKEFMIKLEQVYTVDALNNIAKNIYEVIPVMYRNENNFDIDSGVKSRFDKLKSELITSMESIIRLYESTNEIDELQGFDIKIPNYSNFHEFTSYIRELEFILYQCPFLNKDEEIKFVNVDVGSTWLSFALTIATGSVVLNNLAALIDKAIIIKSHIVNVKQQEELLRQSNLKGDVLEKVTNAYKELLNNEIEKNVNSLENELGKLKDGEERDKASKSLEKLADLLDKGMQIYASIDSPKEIQTLFPPIEVQDLLSTNVVKLLEIKKSE